MDEVPIQKKKKTSLPFMVKAVQKSYSPLGVAELGKRVLIGCDPDIIIIWRQSVFQLLLRPLPKKKLAGEEVKIGTFVSMGFASRPLTWENCGGRGSTWIFGKTWVHIGTLYLSILEIVGWIANCSLKK